MALFKLYRGTEEQLASIPTKDGYAYFLVDTQQLLIDVGDKRLEVRPKGNGVGEMAKYLVALDENGNVKEPLDKFSVDDFLLVDPDGLAVKAGGTGNNTLTANAVLVGNGEDPIKQITLVNKGLIVGDSTDGLKSIAAIGKGSFVVGDDTNGVKALTIDPKKVMVGDANDGAKGIEITDKALVMGDSTNGIMSFVPEDGEILVGDTDDGVTGLHGTGVVYAETDKEPQFGTAPVKVGGTGKTSVTTNSLLLGDGENALKEIANAAGVLVSDGTNTPEYVEKLALENGGTGADNAEDARDNLEVYGKDEVYTKDEIDDLLTEKSSTAAPTQLGGNDGDWVQQGDKWVQTITVDGLKATVPPIIMNTSNSEGYALIESAVADGDAGTITFTASEKPTGPIGITVVDIQ